MYNIIYHDYSRSGLVFREDEHDGVIRRSLDDCAKDFSTLEDAKQEVRTMTLAGIPANHISIVQITPFDVSIV